MPDEVNGEKQPKKYNPLDHIPLEKRWKKGQSGNPLGRPKKHSCFTDIARHLLESKKIDIAYTFPTKEGKLLTRHMHMESDKTMYHGLIAALIKEGLDGNIGAIKELIDRTEGSPKQIVENSGEMKLTIRRTIVNTKDDIAKLDLNQ